MLETPTATTHALSAEAHPAARWRIRRMREWPRLRLASTLVAVLLLALPNLLVQMHRAYFDGLSDNLWGMQRVAACESLGRPPDVLYLGSSRTAAGAAPAVADAILRERFGVHTLGCNAGIFGSTIEEDYYALKRLISDGYVPKVVVETLWEWNLNVNAPVRADEDPGNFIQIERLAMLGDTAALRDHFGSGPRGLAGTALFAAKRLIPLYGDAIGVYRTVCGSSRIGPCADGVPLGVSAGEQQLYEHADRQGWVSGGSGSLAGLSPAAQQQAGARVKQLDLPLYHQFVIGGKEPTYLADLIALAQAHNARVVLVAPPLHPIFRASAFDSPDVLPHISAYWAAFARQHSARYVDLYAAPDFTGSDFRDPSHLNAAGAQRLTSWLALHVLGPMLSA